MIFKNNRTIHWLTVLVILFLSLKVPCRGQSTNKKSSISGYVLDGKSGEALVGATLFNTCNRTGAVSNNYGYFSLPYPANDSCMVLVRFLGYQAVRIRAADLKKETKLRISLVPDEKTTAEVVVTSQSEKENVNSTQMSSISIPIKMANAIPMLAGERDVLKVLQFLPGVQAGQEGTTGFFVRGGNQDQNLVLLDEATVYNPNHLFGLSSTFNSNAINSLTLIKGGFPAQYGGRLSSVLDLTMRDGNKNKFSATGGIGLLSSNLTIEGPLAKGKSSFIVSARRSYLDLFIRPFQTGGNRTIYYFYDINAKGNIELGKNDRLFISIFNGLDKADYTGASSLSYGIKFGNAAATLRWNHLFGDKLFANTSLIYSNYYLSLSSAQGGYYALLYTGIRDASVKSQWEWYPTAGHHIKFGGIFTQHNLAPSAVADKIPKNGKRQQIKPDSINRFYSSDLALYASDDFDITNGLSAQLGVRMPVFFTSATTYVRLEPRISVRQLVGSSTSIKASYTEMNQFLHSVPNSSASLPTDIWISSSNRVAPQFSRQIALGLFKNFKENQIEASIEGYYKIMQKQVLFKEGTQLTLTQNIENTLIFGNGKSFGVELFVRKNKGRLTGWISYTLSKTTQKFADLNFGKAFPFSYDRRHVLTLVGIYQLTTRWKFSADFVFSSGRPYTLPAGRVPVAEDGSLYNGIYADYTGRNNYRFQAYHRLDLNASYSKSRRLWGKMYESEWVFGVYNAYSHLNPYFVYVTVNPATGKPEARQVSLLPIIPSVSFNFHF